VYTQAMRRSNAVTGMSVLAHIHLLGLAPAGYLASPDNGAFSRLCRTGTMFSPPKRDLAVNIYSVYVQGCKRDRGVRLHVIPHPGISDK
jgi:hypothetical protein